MNILNAIQPDLALYRMNKIVCNYNRLACSLCLLITLMFISATIMAVGALTDIIDRDTIASVFLFSLVVLMAGYWLTTRITSVNKEHVTFIWSIASPSTEQRRSCAIRAAEHASDLCA